MLFYQLDFVLFVVVLFVLYFFIKTREWQNLLLCVASFVFYGFYSIEYAFLLFITCFVNYHVAKFIFFTKYKKTLLVTGLSFNLLLLCYYKYISFLIDIERFDYAYDLLEEAEHHSDSIEFVYCRVACLFFWGQRKAALNLLAYALEENFDMHISLFDLFPNLEEEPSIVAMIANAK